MDLISIPFYCSVPSLLQIAIFFSLITSALLLLCLVGKEKRKFPFFSLLDCRSQQLLSFANIESYPRIFGQFQSGFSNIFLHCYAGFPWICEFASFLPLLIFCGLILFSSTWLSFSSLIIVLKSNTSIPKVSRLGPVSEYTSLEFCFSFLRFFYFILILSFLSFCFNDSQGTFSLLPCPRAALCGTSLWLLSCDMWLRMNLQFSLLGCLPKMGVAESQWSPEWGQYCVIQKVLTHPLSRWPHKDPAGQMG